MPMSPDTGDILDGYQEAKPNCDPDSPAFDDQLVDYLLETNSLPEIQIVCLAGITKSEKS